MANVFSETKTSSGYDMGREHTIKIVYVSVSDMIELYFDGILDATYSIEEWNDYMKLWEIVKGK